MEFHKFKQKQIVLKYKKVQKRKNTKTNRFVSSNYYLNNLKAGLYGIKVLEFGRLTYEEIEACRRYLQRQFKKHGLLSVIVKSFIPITKKPAEIRMGKGKGAFAYWGFPVKAGQILFEFYSTADVLFIKNVIKKGSCKLKVKTTITIQKKIY